MKILNDNSQAVAPSGSEPLQAQFTQHPYSALFPPLSEEDLAKLAEDIKLNGQQEPGTNDGAQILDGWHRYLACQRAGVPFQTNPLPPGVNALSFVLSKNLFRRHLTTSQRAAIAADLYELEKQQEEENGQGSAEAQLTPKAKGKRRDAIAKQMKVSTGSMQGALKVKQQAPELHEKIAKGELNVHAALKQLPPTQPEPSTSTRMAQADAELVVFLAGFDVSQGKEPDDLRRLKKTHPNMVIAKVWEPYGTARCEDDPIFVFPIDVSEYVRSCEG